jgi:hypothetical protein
MYTLAALICLKYAPLAVHFLPNSFQNVHKWREVRPAANLRGISTSCHHFPGTLITKYVHLLYHYDKRFRPQ